MRVVPKDNLGAVEFYEVHAPVWQAEAGSIGLSPADADAVADAAAAARAAFQRQQQLQNAARSATHQYEMALEQLRAVGAACVAKIRVAATAAGGAGDDGGAVYGRAQISPPDKPGPLPAPGKPTGFDAQFLSNTGTLRLTWDCKNPRGATGTVYEICRNDDPDGGVGGDRIIAVVGEKRFVDDAIRAGTPAVEYMVTAVRSTRRGEPARHRVSFGTAPGTAPALWRPAA